MPAGDRLLGGETGLEEILSRETSVQKSVRCDGRRRGGGGAATLSARQRKTLADLDRETLPFRAGTPPDLGRSDRGGVASRIERNVFRSKNFDGETGRCRARDSNLVSDSLERQAENVQSRTQVGDRAGAPG